MEVLNKVFDRLPEDIVKNVIEYTGKLTYRNGAFVRIIPEPDANYPLLLERMRFPLREGVRGNRWFPLLEPLRDLSNPILIVMYLL